jgi:D-arabinose 1-dehydrogenase-like Zn-dependent alcohol dehydrogenase
MRACARSVGAGGVLATDGLKFTRAGASRGRGYRLPGSCQREREGVARCPEALAFAGDGKVRTHVHTASLESINDFFAALKAGAVDGRMVLDLGLTSASRSQDAATRIGAPV